MKLPYKLSCLLLVLCCCSLPTQALSTSAEAAILMELESGRILYEENIDQEMLIASITKLMTALLAIEREIPLETPIEIPPEACLVEGSSLYLQQGDTMTLEGLLYGLMLHSGNDAAIAIALACGESVEEFVLQMNEKALSLGMEHSHFANPHGLNQDNHYSTARDMAILAQAVLENEALATIVSTKNIAIDGRQFTNKNKLLWNYEGCIGMKTGYTELAGRTLVSAATQNDMTLICVTLNDRNDWVDHSNLYDYGFTHYAMCDLTQTEEIHLPLQESLLPFVPLAVGETPRYPLAVGEELHYRIYYPLEYPVLAPVTQGEPSGGQVQWYLEEELIADCPLVYGASYDNIRTAEETLWSKVREYFTEMFTN